MMENGRNQTIVRTSIIGIAMNVLLFTLKIIVGTLSGSIAIILDAVNNLSDAASSVITLVGAKLAGKAPDKKYPFGYGRIEYFSALIISLLVLYAGVASLEESMNGILHPETPSYTALSLIIIAIAVVVKIVLGRYFVTAGKRVDSASLINSGKDATLDSVISFSTLVAAGIYLFGNVSLEACLGAVISLIIIKSGCDMMRETLSRLLGERVDADMAKAIGKTIMEFPTVHGVYSINTVDEEIIRIREEISSMALGHDYITQMHGFYLDREQKTIRLDLVVSFDAKDRRAVFGEVKAAIQQKFPEYQINMAMDTDFILS